MRRSRDGRHSLRKRLTLVNVVLMTIGVIAATAISLMGMRHYLLSAIDAELDSSRRSLGQAGITMEQVEALGAWALFRDKLAPQHSEQSLPDSGTVFVALRGGEPLSIAGYEPTERQRLLDRAVADPGSLARAAEPVDITIDGEPHRATATRLGDGTVVVMAASAEAVHGALKSALKLDLAVGTVLVALLGVLTMMEVRRRMRPLEDMVETASAIADGDLTRRVPPSCHSMLEVEQLRTALNTMLHQVESAYTTRERSAEQLRRFVADASHELRTPLAAIRGYLQLHERGMLRAEEERARAQERMNAETERMGHLVDELLTLARLDQGPELRFRQVDLSCLVRDAADDLRVQQPDRPVEVSAEGTLLVRADEPGLRQVVGNLLGNVRAHTPVDAAVRISLCRGDGTVTLRVADEGPGLCEADAARVFDRFFRASPGGAGGPGGPGGTGSGLGMAIVQGVVEAHGGGVSVETAPGKGLAVTVRLPAG
nr:HAMP domain-containing sensor histidine kinase [Streptomyces sp. GC420]